MILFHNNCRIIIFFVKDKIINMKENKNKLRKRAINLNKFKDMNCHSFLANKCLYMIEEN